MLIFGRLFRSPVTQSKRQELVIVVTPELVGDTINFASQNLPEKSKALEQAIAVAQATPSPAAPSTTVAQATPPPPAGTEGSASTLPPAAGQIGPPGHAADGGATPSVDPPATPSDAPFGDRLTEDPTFRYALQVQDSIAKSLQYPASEKEGGMGGQVKLRLRLLRDGTLGQALIAESSGIESLDEATLRVARQQSPYPPFPPDLLQQELWLELPVQFRP
jgi:TonB family protein